MLLSLTAPVSWRLLQNSAVLEGPLSCTLPGPFVWVILSSKPFTQPGLSTAQSIALRIRSKDNPRTKPTVLGARGGCVYTTSNAQMPASVDVVTTEQACALALELLLS